MIDWREGIRDNRKPMFLLSAGTLAYEAEHHGVVMTIEEHSKALEEKDSVIRSLQYQNENLNSTVADLTEKISNISGELGLALDEIARREADFREMRDGRNNIASINKVL